VLIPYQVEITEDQTSPEQLRESFRGIAKDKVCASHYARISTTANNFFAQPYVTELDLRMAHLPAASIDYLREAMPRSENESVEAEFDYDRFIDEVFST